VRRKGSRLAAGLAALPGVRAVRGLGLMQAAELDRDAGAVVTEALARGLVIGTAGPQTLRLTPPLTITDDELELGLELLEGALR
jgi:4-aminobutyrate aminotransferase-like enzyme